MSAVREHALNLPADLCLDAHCMQDSMTAHGHAQPAVCSLNPLENYGISQYFSMRLASTLVVLAILSGPAYRDVSTLDDNWRTPPTSGTSSWFHHQYIAGIIVHRMSAMDDSF